MDRILGFPVAVGFVGAMYGGVCMAQGWLAFELCAGRSLSWFMVGGVLGEVALWGGGIGVAIGLLAALSHILRFGLNDRTDRRAAGRLLDNFFWLGVYAFVSHSVTTLVVLGLLKSGLMSGTDFRFWFPGLFFIGFGIVNLSAILWAVARTVSSEDVLTPRVLMEKLRRSAKLVG